MITKLSTVDTTAASLKDACLGHQSATQNVMCHCASNIFLYHHCQNNLFIRSRIEYCFVACSPTKQTENDKLGEN